MMMRMFAILGFGGLLAACTNGPPSDLPPLNKAVLASAYQTAPFEIAEISIVATVNGDIRSYALRPCAAGICGSRPATIQESSQGTVIGGAYPGITFALSPGGVGAMNAGSGSIPVAWAFAD